jgi:hypothetical protein
VATSRGDVLFDDPVLDKNYSFALALVRAPYSGNAHAVSTGIGVGTCVSVHPDTDQCWLRDSRIYDPEGAGNSKLAPGREMLTQVVDQQPWPGQAVLMDTWYATKDFMLFIASLSTIDDCPLQDKRQGADSGSQQPYRRVDTLAWNAQDLAHGKRIKITGLPKDPKVPLCRVEVATHRTDLVVTNALPQDSTAATQEACSFRWKSEPLHREGKHVTGLERCQCRKARTQRKHIGCAVLVWVRLKELATQTGRTIEQLKHGLLDDYLVQQLKKPSLKMALA